MTNLSNTSFLLTRPYWLSIYAEIIDRLNTTNSYIPQNGIIGEISTASINPYEIAYLQDREIGVIKLVCFELMQMGFVRVQDSQLQTITYFSNTSHLEPIEQAIFNCLHTPKTYEALIADPNVQNAVAKYSQIYRQSLTTQGYVRADKKKYLTTAASGLLLLGLVFGKPLIGMLAGYRYLLLLVGAAMRSPIGQIVVRRLEGKSPRASLAIAATAWLGKKSKSSNHLTAKGKEYLAALKQNCVEAVPKLASPPVKPNSETSLLFTLYGCAAFNDTKIEAYLNLFDLFSTG